MSINKIIEQWLGEERPIKTGSVMDCSLDNANSYGYNQAITDLKSRIPELEKEIINDVESRISYLARRYRGAYSEDVGDFLERVIENDIINTIKGGKE